jgi:hypothetical protein
LCDNHHGIIAEQKEKLAFATTAIFLRFPNEKPEKPIFSKNSFIQKTSGREGKRISDLKFQISKKAKAGVTDGTRTRNIQNHNLGLYH